MESASENFRFLFRNLVGRTDHCSIQNTDGCFIFNLASTFSVFP